MSARRVFVGTPGFEGALVAELADLGAVRMNETAGLVEAAEPTPGVTLDPVFARQQLPAAIALRGASVATLAEAAYAAVEAAVDRAEGPFTLHAFAAPGVPPEVASRATLVGRELLARLQARRRRAARAYVPPEGSAARTRELTLVLQLLLVARDQAWVSAARPTPLAFGWDVAPWPAGVAPVALDRRPPSRAYRKLAEAFLWLVVAPTTGQVCVYLGGAPGGWSYVALAHGARVIAVDRAPMEPPVRGHRGLTAIAGNAFTYVPPKPVDWLLSDVICEPARAFELMQRWLENAWCRNLVVTVKFKGADGYGVLGELPAILSAGGARRWRVKHLHHNKNEVTVMALAASGVRPAAPAGTIGGAR